MLVCLLVCMAFIYFEMPVPARVVAVLCPRLFSWVILRNQLTSSRDVHVNGSMYHSTRVDGVLHTHTHTQIRNVCFVFAYECAQGVSSSTGFFLLFFRKMLYPPIVPRLFVKYIYCLCGVFCQTSEKDQTSAREL